MRYELVDGQGNFGSIDGDNAAAMRYTESRMTKLSSEMLKDLDKETVDWDLNFDETLKEPNVLPSSVPTLLINGSEGIAVGMATKIPPLSLKYSKGPFLSLRIDDMYSKLPIPLLVLMLHVLLVNGLCLDNKVASAHRLYSHSL